MRFWLLTNIDEDCGPTLTPLEPQPKVQKAPPQSHRPSASVMRDAQQVTPAECRNYANFPPWGNEVRRSEEITK